MTTRPTPFLLCFPRCISLLSLSIALASCSFSQTEVDPIVLDAQEIALDVFSARGFLGGSDYERYYLKNDVLWRECGSVSKTRPSSTAQALRGDQVFTRDPNLAIDQRRVERVSTVKQRELKMKAAEVVDLLSDSSGKVPPPGPFFSLGDPGVFEIQITLGDKQSRIITSVDAIAEQDNKTLERTHELFAAVRGVGPTICDSQTFFGISRE